MEYFHLFFRKFDLFFGKVKSSQKDIEKMNSAAKEVFVQNHPIEKKHLDNNPLTLAVTATSQQTDFVPTGGSYSSPNEPTSIKDAEIGCEEEERNVKESMFGKEADKLEIVESTTVWHPWETMEDLVVHDASCSFKEADGEMPSLPLEKFNSCEADGALSKSSEIAELEGIKDTSKILDIALVPKLKGLQGFFFKSNSESDSEDLLEDTFSTIDIEKEVGYLIGSEAKKFCEPPDESHKTRYGQTEEEEKWLKISYPSTTNPWVLFTYIKYKKNKKKKKKAKGIRL